LYDQLKVFEDDDENTSNAINELGDEEPIQIDIKEIKRRVENEFYIWDSYKELTDYIKNEQQNNVKKFVDISPFKFEKDRKIEDLYDLFKYHLNRLEQCKE